MRLSNRWLLLTLLLALVGCRPDVKSADFAVLSDIHLYDVAALGASGPEFELFLAQDRKMEVQSEELLDTALGQLSQAQLDFLLVSGDLTSDGERVNHLLAARKLAAFERKGRDLHVYVVPGNHDIWNPGGVNYKTSPPTPVPNVSPAEFKRIYADLGYREALAQDPASLSYLAEPRPGIWLLAIDSCHYAEDATREITDGGLSAATQGWILARLEEAARYHKTVIAVMHHGAIEHFQGQAQLFPEYLLAGYPAAGKALADAGLRIVFTGHFHANDVVGKDYGTSHLYDVETNALVTWPSSYRLVHLDVPTGTFDIRTEHVTAIPSMPEGFGAFAFKFLDDRLHWASMAQLTSPPFSLDTATATALTPLVVGGFEAHYAGDEVLTPGVLTQIQALLGSSDPRAVGLGQVLFGLWRDATPAACTDPSCTVPDNDVSLVIK